MTLVSVVVPTLDRASLVGGAIETALAQTHGDLEVIVIDGGSTDGTRSVLERYAENERVRVVYEGAANGIARARNRGLARARGEYVCVLDDDDRWHPEKVERQVQRFETLDDSYGVVCTGGIARRNDRIVGTYRPETKGNFYPEILADFGLNPYSGHMIRRTCFDRVGEYDTAFPHGEDWDLAIRLAREYDFAVLPDPLVERRLHNAVDSPGFRDTTDMELVWAKYGDEIERYPEVRNRFVTRWYRRRSRVCLERGRTAEAIRYSLEAARRDPSPNSALLVASACLGHNGLRCLRRVRTRFDRLFANGNNRAPASTEPADRPAGFRYASASE